MQIKKGPRRRVEGESLLGSMRERQRPTATQRLRPGRAWSFSGLSRIAVLPRVTGNGMTSYGNRRTKPEPNCWREQLMPRVGNDEADSLIQFCPVVLAFMPSEKGQHSYETRGTKFFEESFSTGILPPLPRLSSTFFK
jgi:hypothetical protein